MADPHTSTKVCSKCKTDKPASMFGLNASKKDGLQAYCKTCAALYREANRQRITEKYRAWYAENREEIIGKSKANHEKNRGKRLDIMRTYREANRDRLLKQQKAWQESNREAIAEKKRAYYEANREQTIKRTSAYRKANPDKVKIFASNRRAKEIACGGKLSSNIEQKLFKLQRGKCACCGLPLGDNYHLDHIMPLALGGTNTDDNIQLLRAKCNHQKSAKHPIAFMQSKGFLL